MSVERKPSVLTGCAAGSIRWRSRRDSSTSTARSIGTSSSAPSPGCCRDLQPARRHVQQHQDYNKPDSRCKKVFTGGLSSYRRIALMLGLPADTHPRELVKLGRHPFVRQHPTQDRQSWSLQGKHHHGDRSISMNFRRRTGTARRRPLPDDLPAAAHQGSGNRRDERRRLSRMIHDKNRIPILMWRAQHIGHHSRRGSKAVRARCRLRSRWASSRPSSSSPAHRAQGICEYDVAGSIRARGRAGEVQRSISTCRPRRDRDRRIPPDRIRRSICPKARSLSSPAISRAIRHRSRPFASPPSPIATIDPARHHRGALPGSYSEKHRHSSIMRAATAWNVLDRSGVPGITDVWCNPVQAGIHLLIQMKQSYRNQASSGERDLGLVGGPRALQARHRCGRRHRHSRLRRGRLAIAYRVNAGENISSSCPRHSAWADPSTRKRDRKPDALWTGK